MSVVSHEGSAANVHDEELKMVVDGPVANNDVGSEVVPPSAGRRWRGILARRVLPSSDVDSKGSAANVPDEKLEMVVAGPVANNVVGVEVVPPSVGRRWRGVLARRVLPSSVVDLKGSAANVPDEELEMDVAGLVANNAVGAEVVPPSVGSTLARCTCSIGGSMDGYTSDPEDSDPFLPGLCFPAPFVFVILFLVVCVFHFSSFSGIEEARSSRDALCNLSYPDGLTLTELNNLNDVAVV
ncbi:hypothetical protein Tco_1205254, partial [Tanacetum coccineum]